MRSSFVFAEIKHTHTVAMSETDAQILTSVAIGVGVTVLFLIMAVVVYELWRWMKNRRAQQLLGTADSLHGSQADILGKTKSKTRSKTKTTSKHAHSATTETTEYDNSPIPKVGTTDTRSSSRPLRSKQKSTMSDSSSPNLTPSSTYDSLAQSPYLPKKSATTLSYQVPPEMPYVPRRPTVKTGGPQPLGEIMTEADLAKAKRLAMRASVVIPEIMAAKGVNKSDATALAEKSFMDFENTFVNLDNRKLLI
jgi:hypothetical protein